MRALWRHVEYNYRQGGPQQIFRKVLWRIRERLWSESVWLIYQLDVANNQRNPALPLRRQILDFERLIGHRYFKAEAFPEIVRSRLSTGAICHGFFLNKDLANIAWTTRGYLELEPGLSLPNQECVGIFDCFTLPDHQGKGVYTDTLTALVRAAMDVGASSVMIAVDPVNVISIKGIERAGFQPLYQFRRARRFGHDSFHKSGFALRNADSRTK